MKKINFIKKLSLSIISVVIILIGCNAVVEELTAPSTLGNILGIKGIYGGAGIQNDGASMATIRVEVFATGNIPTVGATVTLTTTLGILAATSLITGASGAAVTTLTSGLVTGMAFVTATVDNVSATTAVPII